MRSSIRPLLLTVAVTLTSLSICTAKDLDVNDLVKKNLDSIGPESARASVKSCLIQGSTRLVYLTGEAGAFDGKQVLASEGNKEVLLLKLMNSKYHGERFVSNGQKTSIAQLSPGIYSPLGEFVMVHDEVLKEGLLSGTLSTNWALAHLEERQAKLRYAGLRKVGNVQLHQVDYQPNKRSDLEIKLYFEPDTFRHVLTTYSMTVNPLTASRSDQARQRPGYYEMEEHFGDFKQIDGLQLPSRWVLRFSKDDPTSATIPSLAPAQRLTADGGRRAMHNTTTSPLSARSAYTIQFETIEASVSHTQSLDPRNFEVK
jgi:hypothetical protein